MALLINNGITENRGERLYLHFDLIYYMLFYLDCRFRFIFGFLFRLDFILFDFGFYYILSYL